MSYSAFLERKKRIYTGNGVPTVPMLPSRLYDWQSAIVQWALRKGRAAVFADCGLGKTFMQVSWADALNCRVIILAPLCVADQTVAEAAKLGVSVVYAREQAEAVGHRIVITNYERLDKFDVSAFGGVVLDESSILKAFDGETRNGLIRAFRDTPYRLCCTATPSPNDISELANHAEFLGLMTRPEFLATWFIKIADGHRTTHHHGWRLKRHATEPFYRWLASWAVAVRSPKDLGYDDAGFVLPPLAIREEILPSSSVTQPGELFAGMGGLKGIQGRMAARRTSLDDRVAAVSRLVEEGQHRDGRQCSWLLWCGLNEESAALARAIPGAVEVAGSDTYEHKAEAIRAFVAGETRVLVSKVRILGFGLNFQHCHHMAFVGLSDSYESYYQAIRRCYRYGQAKAVDVVIVVSELEREIVDNVRRKEAAAADLSANLLAHLSVFEREEVGAA